MRSRRSRIWLVLAMPGPGIVAANAGNDAAGIATYASAGSQFVYRTLFFMVLVTVALVLVQEMAVRLGTYTGKGLAALIREQFSLRLTALALVLRAAGQHRAGGLGVRRHRRGVRAARGQPVHHHPDRRRRHLGAGAVRLLPLRRADLPVMSLAFLAYPVAAILGHPDWAAGRREPGHPALRVQQGVPAAGGRPDRDHGQPVHAAVRGGRGGRQGRRPGGLPAARGSTPSPARCSPASSR